MASAPSKQGDATTQPQGPSVDDLKASLQHPVIVHGFSPWSQTYRGGGGLQRGKPNSEKVAKFSLVIFSLAMIRTASPPFWCSP
mmetsp:Transcript_114061/g.198247  ORF Transcript_114061/g.198247 Transcript_114061/m.198247 type:complete len:84 (-) Transcript_114061:190-441(-)